MHVTSRRAPDPVAERRSVTCPTRAQPGCGPLLLLPHGTGPWPALLTRHPCDVTREEDDGAFDAAGGFTRPVAAEHTVLRGPGPPSGPDLDVVTSPA
ncbi:hypothetical protein [Streptomyces albogriseolus]|uniref:hypothetical protein n=1 Tax=Streptomyces albogriseolus TaxID=1887 RepID=UPI0033A6E5F7